MGGANAHMVFTDPPWNVPIGTDANPRHRQRAGLIDDHLPAEQFRALLDGFLAVPGARVTDEVYCMLGASQ